VTVALEGFHAVKHALRFAPDLVDTITVTSIDAVRRLAEQLAPDVTELLLERASVGVVEHPTGVAGTARRPAEDRTVLTSRLAPLVLLDEPRHPGNAGAVIRVAAAAGASGVAMTGTLDPWHATVVRGSAGLHYALPVLRADAQDLAGPFLVLDAAGDERWDVPDDAVLVVGSERSGVGATLRKRADGAIRLPMTPGVSSLNLATATAAVLYRWRFSRSVTESRENLSTE
jgi:TrmH family RNA methyltransferase